MVGGEDEVEQLPAGPRGGETGADPGSAAGNGEQHLRGISCRRHQEFAQADA